MTCYIDKINYDEFFLCSQNLASNFSDTLNIKYDYCLAALNELQNHALDKLKSNEELRNEGISSQFVNNAILLIDFL